jgi:hypothetical protein
MNVMVDGITRFCFHNLVEQVRQVHVSLTLYMNLNPTLSENKVITILSDSEMEEFDMTNLREEA